jgi:hypothetical protein
VDPNKISQGQSETRTPLVSSRSSHNSLPHQPPHRPEPAYFTNVLQSLYSDRMSNSGGLTSLANSGWRQLKAPHLLPRKLPPLDPNTISGRLIEHSNSNSSPASTRWPHSPSHRAPCIKAQPNQTKHDPNLVDTEITHSQALNVKCNEIRLTWANANDARMISKYLPAHMFDIMPKPVIGPDDHFRPPPNYSSFTSNR